MAPNPTLAKMVEKMCLDGAEDPLLMSGLATLKEGIAACLFDFDCRRTADLRVQSTRTDLKTDAQWDAKNPIQEGQSMQDYRQTRHRLNARRNRDRERAIRKQMRKFSEAQKKADEAAYSPVRDGLKVMKHGIKLQENIYVQRGIIAVIEPILRLLQNGFTLGPAIAQHEKKYQVTFSRSELKAIKEVVNHFRGFYKIFQKFGLGILIITSKLPTHEEGWFLGEEDADELIKLVEQYLGEEIESCRRCSLQLSGLFGDLTALAKTVDD